MTENQCTINIPDTSTADLDRTKSNTPNTSSTQKVHHEEWVIKVSNEVKNLTDNSSKESERWKRQSVYRVPCSVKKLCSSSNAYEPQTVSIGPYHHGKQHLKGMEEHKHRALIHFLNRSGKPLQCFLNALAKVVEDLKLAYDQLDEKWEQDTEAFLELMIVDGCFILELMRTTTNTATTDDDQSSDYSTETMMMVYKDNDPVFSKHGKLYIVPYLKRDMLMLENQLPMLVLTTLLVAENNMLTVDGLSKEDEVTRLIGNFLETTKSKNLGKCLHILDVYRKSLLRLNPLKPEKKETTQKCSNKITQWCIRGEKEGKDEQQKSSNKATGQKSSRGGEGDKLGPDEIIRSATELQEAGITIKKSETRYLEDIKFKGGGVLELPAIVVDDTFESGYLNLMAFERFHVGAGNEVTSYVFFMDSIIDSARDVSLLHSCGIIQNALGSDKAVATLFNSLSKDIILDPNSSLGGVHKEVSEYCRKLLPRWKATLKHNYFTNPWAGLSVVAAIFLFALTGLQTVYSVLGYYDPK